MLKELKHRSLDVWQISRILVKDIYRVSDQFPNQEKYELSAHVRKTAVSVISNIAEGASRKTIKERKRFWEIARSSLVELDTQLQITIDLGYASENEFKQIEKSMRSIFKMLSVMMRQ